MGAKKPGSFIPHRGRDAPFFYFIGSSVVRRTWNHEFAEQISQECGAFFFTGCCCFSPVPGYCNALFPFWNGKGNNINLFLVDAIPFIPHGRDASHLPMAHCHQIYFYHIQASIGAAMHGQKK